MLGRRAVMSEESQVHWCTVVVLGGRTARLTSMSVSAPNLIIEPSHNVRIPYLSAVCLDDRKDNGIPIDSNLFSVVTN